MATSVVIVSNRLPISVKKIDGQLEFYPSVGGLATGLAAYTKNPRNKWIGWPGIPSDDLSHDEREHIADKLRESNCYPVFLTGKQLDEYYNGYSNTILWPLFHDMPARLGDHDRFWKAYRKVSAAFADVVLALSDTSSKIWIHDYQLMTLPSLLRAVRPKARIGFFLHIPFPTLKHIRELPSARQLLLGVLGADLIGLHTKVYVQHFVSACAALTREVVEPGPPARIMQSSHVSQILDFPISIDYERITAARDLDSVKTELAKHREKYKGLKVILTVDRLDPTKGLVERLEAYQEFLRRSPALRGKVIMVMLAVPSRTDVDEYKQLKRHVEKLVRDITHEFATSRWQPLDYMYTSMPIESVTALYQVADVAFITPLRDGMNLVAKEYVASRPKHTGALILSNTAGAAQELTDALIVNPHQQESLVQALVSAFKLPKRELKRRIRAMNQQISTHTVQNWSGSFMKTLGRPIPGTPRLTRTLTPSRQKDIRAAFRAAEHPLVLLDYDGVLAPLITNPAKATPSSHVLQTLRDLSHIKKLHIAIVSGRSKADLETWLGDLPINLIAEHGALLRRYNHKPASTGAHKNTQRGAKWDQLTATMPNWQADVLPILEKYAKRTPGALVEAKQFSLVWHYRAASPYYAQKHLVVLRRLLKPVARRYGLGVYSGSKILEIKPTDSNKGAATGLLIDQLPENQTPDFILCIGDDYTDENMFETLPLSAYTIKVGRGPTAARLRLKSVTEAQEFLKKLARGSG